MLHRPSQSGSMAAQRFVEVPTFVHNSYHFIHISTPTFISFALFQLKALSVSWVLFYSEEICCFTNGQRSPEISDKMLWDRSMIYKLYVRCNTIFPKMYIGVYVKWLYSFRSFRGMLKFIILMFGRLSEEVLFRLHTYLWYKVRNFYICLRLLQRCFFLLSRLTYS